MRVHKCDIALSIVKMRKAQDVFVVRAVAAEIKALRGRLDISQEELAHRADVHRSFIARLEVAETQPSLAVLFRLAEALEMDPAKVVRAVSQRVDYERTAQTNRD